MKHIVFLLMYLLAGGAFCLQALEMDSNGCIRAEVLRFSVTCFMPGWKLNAMQSRLPGKVTKNSAASEYVCEMAFPLPGEVTGSLRETFRRQAGDDWELRAELTFPRPVRTARIMLETTLPDASFAGESLRINGKPVPLPAKFAENGNPLLYRGEVSELVIPLKESQLRFRGKFSLHLQDNRKWKFPGYSLRILFTPSEGEVTQAELAVTISQIPYRSEPLDLRSAFNREFRDQRAEDGVGGWTDQGAENDLRLLPLGKRRFEGIEFDIVDPGQNGGKSCLVLGNEKRFGLPRRATAELSGRPSGKYISLLHALAWPEKKQIGILRVLHTDGSVTTIPVCGGRDVDNWWMPQNCPNGTVVWTAENPSSLVGLYRSCFPIAPRLVKSVVFEATGGSVWGIVAASIHDERPPRTREVPVLIAEGPNWKPFVYKRDIQPGSVMDFSGTLDAPAGKYGPVEVRNGKFVFRDRPAEPIRFYGTNLGGNALYLDKTQAEKLADRIAAAGYNALRIHNHDNLLVRHENGSSTVLDPDRLDRLEYFIACLKKRGVYISADLYVSRKTEPGEIPEFPGKQFDFGGYKALVGILPSARENLKRFAGAWLTHVNPYTGVALKDDPVLFSLSLVNENDVYRTWFRSPESAALYRERFAQWRKKHSLPESPASTDNPVFADFLSEVYMESYDDLKQFLRKIGVKIPLNDQNATTALRTTVLRAAYDYVDIHKYWDHPVYVGVNRWNPPSLLRNQSVIFSEAESPARLMLSRLLDRPMMVTEFDFPAPNRFRAEGAVLTGTYAALQDWDGLFQFVYTHHPRQLEGETTGEGDFFASAQDPVKYLAQIIGIRLFLDRGVRPASGGFALILDAAGHAPFSNMPAGDLLRLGLIAKVGSLVVPAGATPPASYAGWLTLDGASPALSGGHPVFPIGGEDSLSLLDSLADAGLVSRKLFDVKQKRYRSATGQIELDGRKGTFRVVSPGCEAVILPEKQAGQGNFLQVKNRVGRGVFAAVSATRFPLKESDRILLFHLTDTQVEKLKFANAAGSRLERFGKGRFLAERGEAEIECAVSPGTEVELYRVDTSGRRQGRVPFTRSGSGAIRFNARVFAPEGAGFLYELVRKR